MVARAWFAAVALWFAGAAQAQLYVEETTGDGVLNPVDFSWRYYVDQMDRFPERLGFICVNAYWLDKTGDHAAAMRFFDECARRGNATSMIYLAHLYEQGVGVGRNPVMATHWLRRAAETGNAVGQYDYGLALLNGHGTVADRDAAQLWLRRAEAQGDADARQMLVFMRNQAQFYPEEVTGDGVLNPSDFSWRYYLDQMRRFPDRIGIICVNAYELDKSGNHAQSFAFFSECARRGNAPSMIYLAHLIEHGLGTDADPAAAAGWLRRSAETGYSVGQYHYGLALLRGEGVAVDREGARHWLQLAAAQGDPDAAAALQQLPPP